MLEPRETDIPALFFVFVVLPLVSYFILGKWSETRKRKERVSLVASGSAEEALQVEDMAVGSIMPVVQLPVVQMPVVQFPNNGIHQCARCFSPATTRCSQCKSVWYCSGRCQIVHWRQVHKLECQHLGNDCRMSSLKRASSEVSRGRVAYAENTEKRTFKYNTWEPRVDNAPLEDVISPPLTTLTSSDGAILNSSEEASGSGPTPTNSFQPQEDAYLREGDISLLEHHANSPRVSKNGDGDLINTLHKSDLVERESLNAFDGGSNYGPLSSSTTVLNATNTLESRVTLRKGEYLSQKRIPCADETNDLNERTSMKRSSKSRIISQSNGIEPHNYPKSRVKVSKEPLSLDTNTKAQTPKDSRVATVKDNIPLQESNRATNLAPVGMKKPARIDHDQQLVDGNVRQRKVKMIFPYEEFVKCFQYEVFNVTPRGLVNCGNSCYANAVLQCLTCTKPLIIYLLRRSHSRAGCAKDWCLMCELEQLAGMLRQNGGPLSPVNILMYLRSLNKQIGDGSQEDAHEFLRLLVASMQSICLEGFGGENVVDPKLQDTTFIQHMFGGSLRSKVKCLRCNHESERYEKMMDLTLEIFGRVESLEDALMQFTSSEDLDGENMYRCARCAAHVRARKQLSIKEAPNILTIVLKRFQEGNYGKINKCITFPEMLDMVPYMTGTDDLPPLYMLYAVVVHLDTSNASFSGHYISYVKDPQNNWFRVDDTEVQPVESSQVMSQGAYILFYMRSYPRPTKKATRHHGSTKVQRSSRSELSNLNHSEPNLTNVDRTNDSRGILIRENRSRPSALKNYAEFSDAASSDWSLFTSSDDSSFTTESTRDSFSTVDHADLPFSSIFHNLYPAESTSRRTISCSVFPGSTPQTRFAREERGFVSASCVDQRAESATAGFCSVNYGNEARKGPSQTSVQCTI